MATRPEKFKESSPISRFPFLGKRYVGEAERVPAEGSGAPGGVKRRAVEALTELKWAGKPGADSP